MDRRRRWLSSRRATLWVVLVGIGALLALLATGFLTKTTGGRSGAVETTPPSVSTTLEGSGSTLPVTQFGAGDWGSYGGSFEETRHSPLMQIGKQNVSQLGRAFTVDFRKIDPSIPKGQQSFPIVIGGIIYVTTAADHVFAVSGGSGKVIWHYVPSGTGIFRNYGVNANRGLAYCDGKLFLLTLDMRVISLDPRTGKLVKEVAISDAVPDAKVEFSYSETQAPICYENTLIFGASGSDFGVRGFVMAYTPDLKPAWPSPYWIVPPELQGWRRYTRAAGGGTNWNPVAIDTETGTVFLTSSNPSPIFAPQLRPGPDPRTDSVIALDLATGRQRWWSQQIAGDQWGYSTSQPPLVFDVTVQGTRRRVVAVGTKEGTWFMYDARTGAPIYQRVRLVIHVEHGVLHPGRPVTVYPSSLGGLNYSPSSFDPGTGFVINNQAETAAVLTEKLRPGAAERNKVRGDVDNGLAASTFGSVPPGWRDYGSITAVDAAKGVVAWRVVTAEPGRGGVTTTASGLSFAGGGDGVLRALDSATGNLLWSFQTGFQIAAAPAVYEAHGKEYLALTVGGTATSSFGGTASQLQVFTLAGSSSQSTAPPIRPPGPTPGLVGAPQAYLSLGGDPHTLELQVVAAVDAKGSGTLDGSSGGAMTLSLPAGWSVNVTVSNQDASRAHRVSVVASGAGAPRVDAPAAFAHASSPSAPPSGVSYFHFKTEHEGTYALASSIPGAWISLRVTPPTSLPELAVGGQTYAVDITGHHG